MSIDTLSGRPRAPQTWNRYAYVEGNPLTYVDPDGLGRLRFFAKIVELTISRDRKVVARLSSKDTAMLAQKSGEDILMPTRSSAREFAQELGDGRPPIHEVGKGKGQYPHYHPGRLGGHIFYGVAATLTFSHYAQGHGSAAELLAELADIFNPLSLGTAFYEVYENYIATDATGGDPIGTFEAYFMLAAPSAGVQDAHYSLYKIGAYGHHTGNFLSPYDLFQSGQLCIDGICSDSPR